jgi:glycyl-tRNA synthetase beta chain
MSAATLVVEVLTEELPPKALKQLGTAFAETLVAGLRARDFIAADATVTGYATPRRLSVTIANVRSVSPDKQFKQKLLPVSVALDATGKPTPTLMKKLAALGLSDASSLIRESDGKADALFHEGVAPGVALTAGLQAALDDAIAKLPIPKVMSYAGPGSYYSDQKFVRPVHKLLALHGADVVSINALGLTAGCTTSGHRFLSRPDIAVATADAYEEALRAEGKVTASFAERRRRSSTRWERPPRARR